MACISPDGVAAYLKRTEGKKDGPLAPVLKLAGEKHYSGRWVDVAARRGAAADFDFATSCLRISNPSSLC